MHPDRPLFTILSNKTKLTFILTCVSRKTTKTVPPEFSPRCFHTEPTPEESVANHFGQMMLSPRLPLSLSLSLSLFVYLCLCVWGRCLSSGFYFIISLNKSRFKMASDMEEDINRRLRCQMRHPVQGR